jgi:hypothetical protein
MSSGDTMTTGLQREVAGSERGPFDIDELMRKELGIPESDMVVAGMCLGYADNSVPENNMILEKFEPEKFAKFIDL